LYEHESVFYRHYCDVVIKILALAGSRNHMTTTTTDSECSSATCLSWYS